MKVFLGTLNGTLNGSEENAQRSKRSLPNSSRAPRVLLQTIKRMKSKLIKYQSFNSTENNHSFQVFAKKFLSFNRTRLTVKLKFPQPDSLRDCAEKKLASLDCQLIGENTILLKRTVFLLHHAILIWDILYSILEPRPLHAAAFGNGRWEFYSFFLNGASREKR